MSKLSRYSQSISLEAIQVKRAEIEKQLETAELDFAIDAAQFASPHLKQKLLFQDQFVCVARKDHPELGQSISLQQYLAAGHIHISSRKRGTGVVDFELHKRGLARRIQMRAQHYWSLPKLLHSTDLLSIMPLTMASAYDLKILQLPFEIDPIEFRLYWHKNADLDPANIWMRDLLAEISYSNPL